MEISARNQLNGTIETIKQDEMMTEVTIKLPGGQEIVSMITTSSARRLNLAEGKLVSVIIKSTEVMLATES
jgi:molybdopterin-binding protein